LPSDVLPGVLGVVIYPDETSPDDRSIRSGMRRRGGLTVPIAGTEEPLDFSARSGESWISDCDGVLSSDDGPFNWKGLLPSPSLPD
jgi:hypothetical protein